MNDLRDLYQEIIIDHNRSPRNFYAMEDATQQKDGFNPLCGDQVTIYLQVENDVVKRASFQGCGCAISIASASLMTDILIGQPIDKVEKLFEKFHSLMMDETIDTSGLGKLEVLAGVKEYPSRIKCATLAWHAMHAALHEESTPVTTE